MAPQQAPDTVEPPGEKGQLMINRTWAQLLRATASERGAGLAEYGLLVLLIAIVALVAVSVAGEEVSSQYSAIADDITNAGG